jgi:DNA polymerase III delta prime subunit
MSGMDDNPNQTIDNQAPNYGAQGIFQGPVIFNNSQPVDSVSDRNRAAMLSKVRAIWVTGLLEQTLALDRRIMLSLVALPDAVSLPLSAQVQELNRRSHPLPPDTTIAQVFDQAGEALLILGAPGTGKTTLLLELANTLLERAKRDPQHPIPVVFNLSSWSERRTALTTWLAEELNSKYGVPRQVAQEWVKTNKLLLLLDGLDEVTEKWRLACAEAINVYRKDHGLVSLAVCSRSDDYEMLPTRLDLQGAVEVQPLSDEQIADFLSQTNPQVEELRQALAQDPALQNLARTPLMINVMALAYPELTLELTATNDPGAWRRQLFDAYIIAMFKRRRQEETYPAVQLLTWLRWLARQMVARGRTVFQIEDLQPDWLSTQGHRLLMRLIIGFIVGFSGGLIFNLLAGERVGFVVAVIGGLMGVFSDPSIRPVDTLRWSWSAAWSSWRSRISEGVGSGCAIGLIIALISGWRAVARSGLIVGLIVGLIFWLLSGLICMLLFLLLLLLSSGFVRIELTERARPNEGIRRSLRNALRLMLVFGICSGVFFGVPFGLFTGLRGGLGAGIGAGLSTALITGVIGGMGNNIVGKDYDAGGAACLRHLILRILLLIEGVAPWNVVRFLNVCVERALLRRVGGGYIFIHRMLMEHIATFEMSRLDLSS